MNETEFVPLLDETLQRQLGFPNEHELIEILNKHEYQLKLEQDSPLLATLGDRGAQRARQVALIQQHLARRQGGTLDRFGLRDLSLIELEHRRKETEEALNQLGAVEDSRPQTGVGQLFKGFGQILGNTNLRQYQLFVKRRILSELQLRIGLKRAAEAAPKKPSAAEEATEKVKAGLKKIAELQKACEETIKHTPTELHTDVRRLYQKQIDRIREEEL